jgi:hypothetical protein
MDQANGPGLYQVIHGLTTVGVTLGQMANEWLVQHD